MRWPGNNPRIRDGWKRLSRLDEREFCIIALMVAYEETRVAIQRTKRLVSFAKQDPGRARQSS